MKNAVLPNTSPAPVNLPGGNDHPVVELPFTAVIDGRQFRGQGLSLVAAYVSGLMDPATLNTTRIIRLVFQFDGFSVMLVVEAEVRKSARGPGEAELIFMRPTGPHLQQLRHILNAFIAGDHVGLGQTIGVAGTAAPKGPKEGTKPESRFSLRRIIGGASILVLSLALVAVAGSLTYQRLYITLVPDLGAVISTGEAMRATTTGQIVFLDPTATKGEVVVAIQSPSGDVQSLFLPCDCTARAGSLHEGSTVLVGEPVLQLANDGDERLVAVTVPAVMLFDLISADRIELTFPSGAKTDAVVES
jgi:alginate biosynthesis protein Alg44